MSQTFPTTSGIYQIRNTVNGKCYVGQAENLDRRLKVHIKDLMSGKHFNKHLQAAWKLYGKDAFEFRVITECEKQHLDTLEIYWIEKLDAFPNGYNMGTGGNSNRGWKMSDEARQKMRDNHADVSGSNNPMYGISLLDILEEEKISSWKRKLSEAISGEKNPFFGKKHTDKTKAAISAANKGKIAGKKHPCFGKPMSEEHKEKLFSGYHRYMDSRSHSEMPTATKVVCLNTGEYFGSIVDACDKYNIISSSISSCCSGKYKSAGIINGEHAVFAYLSDYEKMTEDEVAERIKVAQAPTTGENNRRSKPVVCINDGVVYANCRDAAQKLGLDFSSISKACRGIIKSCGKDNTTSEPLCWMFYDDYLQSHANHESEALTEK